MPKKCPECGSLAVRRSSFAGPEEQQDHILLSPYRCQDCNARFWVIGRKARRMMIAVLILIILTTVWMVVSSLLPTEPPEERLSGALSGSAIQRPDAKG